MTPALTTEVENKVALITSSRNVGRLPHNILAGFLGLTADQWRNWTVVFSEMAIKGITAEPYFSCWSNFSKACQILCIRAISTQHLAEADQLLNRYCEGIESLFGSTACTINMHKHLK